MAPYLLILVLAAYGAVTGGASGFFLWGAGGFLAVLVIGFLVGKIQGGMVPRKIREETITDFFDANSQMVIRTYQGHRFPAMLKKMEALLDQMFRRANSNNPSLNVSLAGNKEVFMAAAKQVAEEQPTHEERQLAHALIRFLESHRHWYGRA